MSGFARFLAHYRPDVSPPARAPWTESQFGDWLGGEDRDAGHTIPLFLSGSDSIDNLEITDMAVHLSLQGQMLAQVT